MQSLFWFSISQFTLWRVAVLKCLVKILNLNLIFLILFSTVFHAAKAESANTCSSLWSVSFISEQDSQRRLLDRFVPRSLKKYFVSKMYLSAHSQLRMRERQISEDEVFAVLDEGQVIFYKELNGDFNTKETKLAIINGRPLHVVYFLDAVSTSYSRADRLLTVATVYEVDDIHWQKDLRTPIRAQPY